MEKRKAEYYGQLDNKNPKELWQRINEHRSNIKQDVIKFTPDDLSRGFRVWKEIEPQDLTQFTTPPLDAPPQDFISPHMVMYQLEQLDTKKAPGPDGVSAKILYHARESVLLHNLFIQPLDQSQLYSIAMEESQHHTNRQSRPPTNNR